MTRRTPNLGGTHDRFAMTGRKRVQSASTAATSNRGRNFEVGTAINSAGVARLRHRVTVARTTPATSAGTAPVVHDNWAVRSSSGAVSISWICPQFIVTALPNAELLKTAR